MDVVTVAYSLDKNSAVGKTAPRIHSIASPYRLFEHKGVKEAAQQQPGNQDSGVCLLHALLS